MGNVIWFTNLEHKKRNEKLLLHKEFNTKDYPKYDSYNAVNTDKIINIPKNYYNKIGVPISYIMKHNPHQFEIVDFINGKKPAINGKAKYARLIIKRKVQK